MVYRYLNKNEKKYLSGSTNNKTRISFVCSNHLEENIFCEWSCTFKRLNHDATYWELYIFNDNRSKGCDIGTRKSPYSMDVMIYSMYIIII